jgi:hypothetical protein
MSPTFYLSVLTVEELWASGMAQVAEHSSSKLKALNSNLSLLKTNKKGNWVW